MTESAGTSSNDVRAQYVEELAMLFVGNGMSRMAGRVLAFLLLNGGGHASSGVIAAELQASAGSISIATRELAEAGYIRRLAVPGSRSHHFRAEDDMWGTFLSAEHQRIARVMAFVEEIAQAVHLDARSRRRLDNMRAYYVFLHRSYARLQEEWAGFK